jgi:hypothetical protein
MPHFRRSVWGRGQKVGEPVADRASRPVQPAPRPAPTLRSQPAGCLPLAACPRAVQRTARHGLCPQAEGLDGVRQRTPLACSNSASDRSRPMP